MATYDVNKNGIDDREEDSESQENASTEAGSTDTETEVEETRKGVEGFRGMFDELLGSPVGEDDDLLRNLRLGLGYNTLSNYFGGEQAKDLGLFQSDLYKDNALFGADLELRNQGISRADEFAYSQRNMENAFQLQDEFQNRQLGRDLTGLAAQGEDGRKTLRAAGVENRLQTITEGEQERLGIAATGDQTRQNLRVTGDENRKTRETEGEQTRMNLRVTGDENRKTRETEGDQTRKTLDFSDLIAARKEERAKDRSMSLARGF